VKDRRDEPGGLSDSAALVDAQGQDYAAIESPLPGKLGEKGAGLLPFSSLVASPSAHWSQV
jgi:hypothetical protein